MFVNVGIGYDGKECTIWRHERGENK